MKTGDKVRFIKDYIGDDVSQVTDKLYICAKIGTTGTLGGVVRSGVWEVQFKNGALLAPEEAMEVVVSPVECKEDRKAIALWRLANTIRTTQVDEEKKLGQEYAAQTCDKAAIALAGPDGYDRIKRQYNVDLDNEEFTKEDKIVLDQET